MQKVFYTVLISHVFLKKSPVLKRHPPQITGSNVKSNASPVLFGTNVLNIWTEVVSEITKLIHTHIYPAPKQG